MLGIGAQSEIGLGQRGEKLVLQTCCFRLGADGFQITLNDSGDLNSVRLGVRHGLYFVP